MKNCFCSIRSGKNLIFAVMASIVLPFHSYSQEKYKSQTQTEAPDYKGYVMFSLGPSIPQGYLANQDVSNNSAGLAKTGLDIRVSGAYKVSEYFGLCGLFNSQAFSVNAQAMADYYAKMSPGINYSVQINAGWGLGGMSVGCFGSIPLTESKRAFFEPKAMIGFGLGTSPAFMITASQTYYGATQTASVQQLSGSSDMVTTYILGAGLRFYVKKRLCLAANVDYFALASKAHFHDVIIKDSYGHSDLTSFDQEMKSVSITFGLGYRFGKN